MPKPTTKWMFSSQGARGLVLIGASLLILVATPALAQNAQQSGALRNARGGRGGNLSPEAAKVRDDLQQLAYDHQVRINSELAPGANTCAYEA